MIHNRIGFHIGSHSLHSLWENKNSLKRSVYRMSFSLKKQFGNNLLETKHQCGYQKREHLKMHVFRSLYFVLTYSERSWGIKDCQSKPMLAQICNALFQRQIKWSREIEQSFFGPVLIRTYSVCVMFLIQRSSSREFQNC